MEILAGKKYQEFLDFLPEIKASVTEWQLLNIALEKGPNATITIYNLAQMLARYFSDKDGRIYVCSHSELIMLIRNGKETDPVLFTKEIESALPEGSCSISIDTPFSDRFSALALSVKFCDAPIFSDIIAERLERTENVILIADDDLYMRTLVKKGIDTSYRTHEVSNGSEVLAAYKKYMPDILFQDIHMPGKEGLETLLEVLTFDPQAYVVMLSSDSSTDNVLWTTKHGAKGFMAKPFTKGKLLEYIKKCPTIS